jgi:hypothetical protein
MKPETRKLALSAATLLSFGVIMHYFSAGAQLKWRGEPWYLSWIPGTLSNVGSSLIIGGLSLILIEWALRVDLLKRMADASRRFFTNDERLGQAIYQELIIPYIGRDVYYREDLRMKVRLQPLSADIPLSSALALSRDEYLELSVHLSFRAPVDLRRPFADFFATEFIEDLSEPFKSTQVIYRDGLQLADQHRDALQAIGQDPAAALAAIQRLLLQWRLQVDGKEVPHETELLSGSTLGLRLRHRYPEDMDVTGRKVHVIDARTPFHFARKAYPAVLAYPYRNPAIVFEKSGTRANQVAAYPFFSTANPFDLQVKHEGWETRVSFRSEAWTFPNSGVVFTWP